MWMAICGGGLFYVIHVSTHGARSGSSNADTGQQAMTGTGQSGKHYTCYMHLQPRPCSIQQGRCGYVGTTPSVRRCPSIPTTSCTGSNAANQVYTDTEACLFVDSTNWRCWTARGTAPIWQDADLKQASAVTVQKECWPLRTSWAPEGGREWGSQCGGGREPGDATQSYRDTRETSSPWIWKGVSATSWSDRYTLSHPRWRTVISCNKNVVLIQC